MKFFQRESNPSISSASLPRPLRLCGEKFSIAFTLYIVAVAQAASPTEAYESEIAPILSAYCTDCHGGKNPEANLRLNGNLSPDPEKWFKVLEQIETANMPPEDEDQPSEEERKQIADWIRGPLSTAFLAKQKAEGRAGFRRLTRSEYANTITDLLGYTPNVEDMLPPDGKVNGYEKVAPALPLSSQGALAYIDIAEETISQIFARLPNDYNPTVRAQAVESGQSAGQNLVLDEGKTIVSFNTDVDSGRLKFKGAQSGGVQKIRVSAYGFQTEKPMPFGVYVGRTGAYPQVIRLAAVLEAPPGSPGVMETEVFMRKGEGMRLIPFGLGVPVPKNSKAAGKKVPGLAVQWVDVTSPPLPITGEAWLTADFPPELVEEIRKNPRAHIPVKSKSYASKIATEEGFLKTMEKTYARVSPSFLRREPTSEEKETAQATAKNSIAADKPLADILREMVSGLLLSPSFLCVIESPGKLDDHALAARLSRFLWDSTPDAELLELAGQKKLTTPATLSLQIERLLTDPKSDRFIAGFSDQWLALNAIDETTPDKKLNPEYNEWTKFSSLAETRLFLKHLLADPQRPIAELANPGYTFLNSELARHYGLPDPGHPDLRLTKLPADSPYGGVFTHSSVLKVTANGTNTTPVKRGVWLSDRFLGIHIPPPPSDINPIEPDTRGATTLREQLALHRDSKSCAACHARFDPYGFALESFDVAGKFREKYRFLTAEGKTGEGSSVDPSGTTPDGTEFADIRQLRAHLAASPEAIATGLTRHLVTYATGAPPTLLDEPEIQKIVAASAKHNHSFRSIIHHLARSPLFLEK